MILGTERAESALPRVVCGLPASHTSSQMAKQLTTKKQSGALCGARKKDGTGRCQHPAGWGTLHPGTGKCKRHGGSVPSHQVANAVPSLALLVGYDVDVSPMEALVMCVRIKAAEVAYYSAQIAAMDPKAVLTRPREEALDKDGYVHDLKKQKQVNIWVRLRDQAMDRLAKYAKMALDAGVDERMIRVAEGVGAQLAAALGTVLDGLGLSKEQQAKAPDLIRSSLLQLERAGAAA